MRIGIDLGGTKTEGIVMDKTGATLLRERRPTPNAASYGAILDVVTEMIRELELESGKGCRIGVGTPGAISVRTGCMKNCNTTILNGRPLKQDLEQRLGRTIRLANDANCFALSEATDGAARDYPIVFGVIMGTGVGGGVIIDKRVHVGPQRIAGEWGHNILESNGPACYCGKRGCVETFISGPGLSRDYRDNAGKDLSAQEIIDLAAQGEPRAEAATQRFLDRFGRAMASLINVLDPDAVVIGGGLSNIDRLYGEGRDRVTQHVFSDEFVTPLLRNMHGDSSGVRGAAQLWPPADDG